MNQRISGIFYRAVKRIFAHNSGAKLIVFAVIPFVTFHAWQAWERKRPDLCMPIRLDEPVENIPIGTRVGEYCIYVSPLDRQRVIHVQVRASKQYERHAVVERMTRLPEEYQQLFQEWINEGHLKIN